MKKFASFVPFVFAVAFLVACGDDDSFTPAPHEDDLSHEDDTPEYSSDSDDGKFTDSRDGQVYKTVKIGDQIWMAENLNYAYLQPTTRMDSSSFCYENSADSCAKYGRLYLWSAAIDSAAVLSTDNIVCGYGWSCTFPEKVRGVCPEGWHLPSKDEWETLITTVGGSGTAGERLKSRSGWNDRGGKDDYGFAALPAGYYGSAFGFAGDYAFFWSSTEFGGSDAYDMKLYYSDSAVLDKYDKFMALSVRCVKD